jgi:hypothetical protein
MALGGYCNEPAYAMDHSLFIHLPKVVHHFVVRQPYEVLDVSRTRDFNSGSVLYIKLDASKMNDVPSSMAKPTGKPSR